MAAPESSATTPLISTVAKLSEFLDSLSPNPSIYLDLEGVNLCRHGTISLITILVLPQETVRVVDVTILGKAAFTTSSTIGISFKTMFEDANTPKYFWDTRNDADALFSLYGVRLAGVMDIQLLENASRDCSKKYLSGLNKCVCNHLRLGFDERLNFVRTKKEVRGLMDAGVFDVRPLPDKVVQYAVNDVLYLPRLRDFYMGRIESDWLVKVEAESAHRVTEACSESYVPQSYSKKYGPWGV